MGHRDMIWSRHQPAQLLAWGIRFFLAAALTATQTPGDYAPFALGCVAACGPQLVPPVFRREVHGLFGFFHYFTGCVEKIPSGKESRAISGLDAHSGLLQPDMV